ncbi:murein transglycosylase domain-containing protein [Desulfurobacterium sp.]
MKRGILISIVIGGLFISQNIKAENFNTYYQNTYNEFKSYNSEFYKYKKRVDEEFEAYKKIMEEEFENYKKNIEKEWKNPIVPSQKVFVEYSNNYKARKIVDFNNTTVKIEVLRPQNYKKELLNNLTELIIEKNKRCV